MAAPLFWIVPHLGSLWGFFKVPKSFENPPSLPLSAERHNSSLPLLPSPAVDGSAKDMDKGSREGWGGSPSHCSMQGVGTILPPPVATVPSSAEPSHTHPLQ